jgi:hypothetical protein
MIVFDHMSVFLSAMFFLFLGGLWYSSFLFGAIWVKLCGFKNEDLRWGWKRYLGAVIQAIVMAYFLNFVEFYFRVTSFWDGVITGGMMWLGCVAPVLLFSVIWEKRSFKLYLLNSSYYLLGYLVMGGLLAG